ncbi:MAG: ABC transporter substrate-binding protein [Alphaproteobacteria bacterium]
MKYLILTGLLCLAFPAAAAEGAEAVRIGVLTAKTGAHDETRGSGSVLAAQMAIEDFGGKALGQPIEIVTGNHQNRPSVGASIVRRWFQHGGVDVVVNVPNPGVAEAVREAVAEHHGLLIMSVRPFSSQPEHCQSQVITWGYDADWLARGAVKGLAGAGVRSWSLFGTSTRHGEEAMDSLAQIIAAAKGQVVAARKLPALRREYPSAHSLVEDLHAANADIVALNMGPAALKAFSQDLHGELGGKLLPRIYSQAWPFADDEKQPPEIAGEVIYALPYEDGEGARDFSSRFTARADGRKPNLLHLSVYAAILHYLKAVEALNADRPGELVGAKMQELPTEDAIFGAGAILPSGRRVGNIYLYAHHAADADKKDELLSHLSYADMGGAAALAPCEKEAGK